MAYLEQAHLQQKFLPNQPVSYCRLTHTKTGNVIHAFGRIDIRQGFPASQHGSIDMKASTKLAFAAVLCASLFSLQAIFAKGHGFIRNPNEMPAVTPTAGANSKASIPHRRRGEFGNKHKVGCPGIAGWCRYGSISDECVGDCRGEFSILLTGNESALITIEVMPGKFDPERDMADKVFVVAEDYPIENPHELGYRTLYVAKGDYPFDWGTRSFTATIKGIKALSTGTRPMRDKRP